MRILLLLAIAFSHSLSCDALMANDDGIIVSEGSIVLPAFESNPQIGQYATREEYQTAKTDDRFALKRIVYKSDGLNVNAYLYAVRKSTTPRPLIIFNRGSYVVNGQAEVLLTMFHRLAQEGFVVLAPMLRGSDCAAGHDQLGGDDRSDIANAIKAAPRLDGIDIENVFMYGESRGGIMTFLALRDGLPIMAAATFGAITDLDRFIIAMGPGFTLPSRIWPDFEQRRSEIVANRSALAWPDRISKPILLMHGGADPQVDVAHTLDLALALHRHNKAFALRIFDGDNHIISRNRIERDLTVARFFKKFLDSSQKSKAAGLNRPLEKAR